MNDHFVCGDSPERIWHKNLYNNYGLPDNYVDKSFFDDIKRNINVRTYNFVQVVKESTTVTQQLSCVVIFLIIYLYMVNNLLSPASLLLLTTFSTFFCYLINLIFFSKVNFKSIIKDIKSIVIFLLLGYALSPILSTLTQSISTDTIYAMVFFMLIGNLLFHDYGTTAPIVSQSISLNMSIFASVCLASRLPTFLHTFSIIIMALTIFGLWPLLRRKIKERSIDALVSISLSTSFITGVFLSKFSLVASVVFFLAHVIIICVCPTWLIYLQQYKDNLHGPWDEADLSET